MVRFSYFHFASSAHRDAKNHKDFQQFRHCRAAGQETSKNHRDFRLSDFQLAFSTHGDAKNHRDFQQFRHFRAATPEAAKKTIGISSYPTFNLYSRRMGMRKAIGISNNFDIPGLPGHKVQKTYGFPTFQLSTCISDTWGCEKP